MTINSATDWWTTVESNWSELREIIYMFLPVTKNEDYNGNIMGHPLSKEVEVAKENKDTKLARYFNAAWSAAPDHGGIWAIPSWGILCDLCSEEYVLYEDTR